MTTDGGVGKEKVALQAFLDDECAAHSVTIDQRDDAHEVIDELCDAVLGSDRPEWSSMYYFADAVEEVKDRLARYAELLAADKEYDEALAMVDDIAGCPFPSDFERLDAATARRASALAALEGK